MSESIESAESILQAMRLKVSQGRISPGVENPVRGELYRFYSPCVPNGFYYVQWLNWATNRSDGSHVVVCPRLKFFKTTTNVALGVIQIWNKIPLAALLCEVTNPLERTVALALLRLAEDGVRREIKKGRISFSERGPVSPPVTFREVGVPEWKLFVCCKWCQWEEGKVSWEARAADVRGRYPKRNTTRDGLRRECAKDRLGLRA